MDTEENKHSKNKKIITYYSEISKITAAGLGKVKTVNNIL